MKNWWAAHHHMLMALAGKVKDVFNQLWTTESVPDSNQLTHNFNDGKGAVSAVPADPIGLSTSVIKAIKRTALTYGKDNIGITTNISGANVRIGMSYGKDNVGLITNILNASRSPEPIILQVVNNVTEKIANISPMKTEALPNGDFVFKITYVDGYSYIDGDIWTSYGTLSSDGTTLTVNSDTDLSVTLVIAPSPQEWLNETPSESAIQEDTDVQLTNIPRDGNIVRNTIESAIIGDYLFYIKVLNNATNIITNITNGTFYTTATGSKDLSLTYASGYDHNDVVFYIYNAGSMPSLDSGWAEIVNNVFVYETCTAIPSWGSTDTTLKILHLSDDVYVTFEVSDAYKNPIHCDDGIDNVSEVTGMIVDNYFAIVNLTNNAADYFSANASYRTAVIGTSANFTLTYKTGYDSNDLNITCTDPSVTMTNTMASTTTSTLTVSDFNDDITVTINKNDDNKKYVDTGLDSLDDTYDIRDVIVDDYFYVVNVSNTVSNIVTVDASYKTSTVNGTLNFKCTFTTGYDYRNLDVSAGVLVVENDVTYLRFENITDDISAIIAEKPPVIHQSTEWGEGVNESIEYSETIENMVVDYCFYTYNIVNTSSHISFSNAPDGYITDNTGSNIVLIPVFEEDYNYSDFIVSVGTLENNGWTIPSLGTDETVYIMDNDYHDPKSDGDDDLGIFTGSDKNTFGQYRIVSGDGTIVSSFAVINDQPARMANRSVFAFLTDEFDLVNWDTTQVPGNVHTYWVSSDANVVNEVISTQEVDGKTLYRHDIDIASQFTLEFGKQYIFKVRDANQPDNTIIAYAKDTDTTNIICSNDEHYKDGSSYYMKWDTTNYIVSASKMAYLEINSIKI